MSHKTILCGFAAAALGLSLLGGALPAATASTTSFAPTSQSSDHDVEDDNNKCRDVNFYKHRGHWHVTWRDSDGEHNERADSFRDALDTLKDECDELQPPP